MIFYFQSYHPLPLNSFSSPHFFQSSIVNTSNLVHIFWLLFIGIHAVLCTAWQESSTFVLAPSLKLSLLSKSFSNFFYIVYCQFLCLDYSIHPPLCYKRNSSPQLFQLIPSSISSNVLFALSLLIL